MNLFPFFKLFKFVPMRIISFDVFGNSTPNIFSGYDYYGNDGMSFYTTPNIFGGYNYHNNSWGW